jgi:ribonuclease P protein component
VSGEVRATLPRECRLLRRAEYDAVYSEGRRRSSRDFAIFLRANGLRFSRFGWSVKKATGNAVQRNRIRRRLREIVRRHRQEIAGGWDIVIHPRSSAATADFSALTRDLLSLLPRSDRTAG